MSKLDVLMVTLCIIVGTTVGFGLLYYAHTKMDGHRLYSDKCAMKAGVVVNGRCVPPSYLELEIPIDMSTPL